MPWWNKIKSPALLMSFSKLMDAAADCFVTSLSQEQISALVRMQLSDLSSWDIQSYTVTGTSCQQHQVLLCQGAEALRHETGRFFCKQGQGNDRVRAGR